jgi:hypothetical protein
MSTVQDQLADFVEELIEHTGGVMEWDGPRQFGEAIVAPELARELGCHDDGLTVTTQVGGPGQLLSLTGDFLESAGRAASRLIPAAAALVRNDLHSKKSEFAPLVNDTFVWQNARAKNVQASSMLAEYHTWWFQAALHSEDVWEGIVQVTVNRQSLVPLALNDFCTSPELGARSSSRTISVGSTLETAMRRAGQLAVQEAQPFLVRTEVQRERDRQRLERYYAALLKQAGAPSRRTKVVPNPVEIQEKKRIVQLELRRKVSELEERYSVRGVLTPIAVAAIYLPVTAVDVQIQRKMAVRGFRLFWNPLMRKLEPLVCSRCQWAGYSFWFENDTVRPLCKGCHGFTHPGCVRE